MNLNLNPTVVIDVDAPGPGHQPTVARLMTKRRDSARDVVRVWDREAVSGGMRNRVDCDIWHVPIRYPARMLALILVLLVVVLMAVVFIARNLRTPLGGVAQLQTDLKVIAERVSGVERMQGAASQNLAALQTDVSAARSGVSALRGHAESRVQMDDRVAKSVQRLEAIIAGTHSKGAAGENY